MFGILQINVGRGVPPQDMAVKTAVSYDCDIIVISEPSRRLRQKRNMYFSSDKSCAVQMLTSRKIWSYNPKPNFVAVEIDECFIYSVYISPNCELEVFLDCLFRLAQAIRSELASGKPVLVMGDFNAKNVNWGGTRTDQRGKELLEWANANDLNIHNDGVHPTCVRWNGSSFIDLTMSSDRLTSACEYWCVTQEETLSDHQYIVAKFKGQTNKGKFKWIYGLTDNQKFLEAFGTYVRNRRDENVDTCIQSIRNAYELATPKIKTCTLNPPYWWTTDIHNQIKLTRCSRRRYQRCPFEQTRLKAQLWEDYKSCKRDLRNMICKSKKCKWNELILDLDSDIFGEAYKIVVNQMKVTYPRIDLTIQQKAHIFRELFITNDTEGGFTHNPEAILVKNCPAINEEELLGACNKLKTGKAPGPDRITPETIKLAVTNFPEYFLQVFNKLMRKNEFPRKWKAAKLVLIEKPKKQELEETKYRPICLLDVTGKLFEIIIKNRLLTEIEERGGLNDRQYGFRKGYTTIDAIQNVQSSIMEGRLHGRTWGGMVLLDIRNAFNTAPWAYIVKKLENRGISQYLLNIIKSYLSQRTVYIGKERMENVRGGVPQGSVLGPLLWNVLYDDVMDINLPQDVKIICYADDLVVVATTREKRELELKINLALDNVCFWMKRNRLKVAPEKTTAIVFTHSPKHNTVRFEIEDREIVPSRTVMYLGVKMHAHLSYCPHVRYVTEKAMRVSKKLSILLPNIGGPREARRRVMATAVQAIILYAAPIWGRTENQPMILRKMLIKAQRVMALRICSAYRTVSGQGAMVVAGLMPLHILADERTRLFQRNRPIDNDAKKAERQESMGRWQREWDLNNESGQTTKALIPQIRPWIERKHGEVGYHVTQFLTGHGSFGTYLTRIGRRESETCPYCGDPRDDWAHTLFNCERWHIWRLTAENAVGTILDENNLIPIMLTKRENWSIVETLMVKIITRKENDEKSAGRGDDMAA